MATAIEEVTYKKQFDNNMIELLVTLTVSWVGTRFDHTGVAIGWERIKTTTYQQSQVADFVADCATMGTSDAERDRILSAAGWLG